MLSCLFGDGEGGGCVATTVSVSEKIMGPNICRHLSLSARKFRGEKEREMRVTLSHFYPGQGKKNPTPPLFLLLRWQRDVWGGRGINNAFLVRNRETVKKCRLVNPTRGRKRLLRIVRAVE